LLKKVNFSILIFTILAGFALSISPDRSFASDIPLFEKGADLFKKGEYQRAIDTFSKVIEKTPKHVEAFRIRGSSYMKLAKYDLAIQDFETAISLAPKDSGVYSDLGTAWYYNKNYEKALSNYNTEIKMGQKNHLVFFNRALCFEKLEMIDPALKDVSASLALKPDFYWGLCYRGNLLTLKKNYTEAAKAYQAAIGIDNTDTYAKEKLAQIKSKIIPPQKKSKKTSAWSIQSGAFRVKENAFRLKNKLRESGFDTRVIQLEDSKGRPWYLVRSGFYADKQTAEKAVPQYKKIGLTSVVQPAETW